MKKKVVEIFIDEDDEHTEISIDFEGEFDIIQKLGILEWAKSVIVETTTRDQALSEYSEEEL